METAILTIPAMQTEAIALQVAGALESVTGVERVHISLAHARVRVGFDEARVSAQALRTAVQLAGFSIDTEQARSGCCGGCGG